MNQEVTTIDGKFYKKCKVITLPTKDRSHIVYNNAGGLFYAGIATLAEHRMGSVTNQHLYVLSNEEIKENDWYYNSDYKYVKQCVEIDKQYIKNAIFYDKRSTVFDYSKDCTKIIATTDSALTTDGFSTQGKEGTYIQQPLPRLSNPFIKKYCQLGGIDEVLVEYNYTPSWDEGVNHLWYDLKLAPDNTITVKQYKEKLYNTDEVVKLFELERAYRERCSHFVDTEDLPNWIKKQQL